MPTTFTRKRISLRNRCFTDDALHIWVHFFTGLHIPRVAVCPHHDAPFDYLHRAYFEPASDLVVWAPRGGGKTRLAAIATLLDLLHKPGCAVRILGGSLEQSLRMWEHLLPDLEHIAKEVLAGRIGAARRVTLQNKSSAAVLTQSQRAVRGLRVQKLRCDEVELFKPDVWEAAALVTRSRDDAHGAVEAISTLHAPSGLMQRIIDRALHTHTRVIRWCLLEVLERCDASRDCASCPLWDDCHGIAKTKCDGFVSIDDAIAMKRRVSRETWEAEVLCLRPSIRGCVFPSFDVLVHVNEEMPIAHYRLPISNSNSIGNRQLEIGNSLTLAIDFGFAAPFVCLWIADHGEICHVIDEYVQEQQTVDVHLDHIESRRWGKVPRIACDPAGAGRNEQTAASNIALMKSRGYVVRTRKSRIVDGIETIRAELRPASGEPRLFIHPRCTHLIRALQSYRYAEGGSELPIKDGEHDHPINALRYFYVNRRGSRAETRRY